MRGLFIALMAILLTGCASAPTPEPRVVTRTVEVAVTQPCPAKLSPDPAYPDREADIRDAGNVYNRARIVMAGRLMRTERERELRTALVDVCGVIIPHQ